MSIESSWLVGSFDLSGDATIVVNAVNTIVNSGVYYLRDAIDAGSLLAKVEAAIVTQVAGATVYIGQDRKVRIDGDGNVLTLAIPQSLQAVLGMPANPTPGTLIVADDVSTLLWSPGWPETPTETPVGVDGRRVYDRIMTSSPTGMTTYTTVHHYTTIVAWSWHAVAGSRAWTTAELPGEYVTFLRKVLVTGHRFKLYSNVVEDSGSSSSVTWPTAQGPYVARKLEPNWYVRAIAAVDGFANIKLDALLTSEIA